MKTDEADKKTTRGAVWWICAVIVAALLLYAISFGPSAYLMTKFKVQSPKVIDAFTVIFYPHYTLMYHQEWYFDYATWFHRAAGGRNPSYETFRQGWATNNGYPLDQNGNPIP